MNGICTASVVFVPSCMVPFFILACLVLVRKKNDEI